MTIQKLVENWEMTPSSIQLLENIIAETKPDVAGLDKWFKQYGNTQKKRLSYDIDYVERFASKGSKILEFGSVPPLLTSALSRLGYDVVGLDLEPDRFKTTIVKEKITIEKVNFETEVLPFEDNSFDVVIFNEVFEHLRINPIFTLREVRRVLKKDGQLMLSTPNLMSWKGWYNFVVKSKLPPNLYQEYMKLELLGHMGHVRLYSPVEVIQFLKEIGLKVEVIIHRGEWKSPSDRKRYWGNRFLKIFPKYRSFFSVVARKI